ncbi:hypothetical protein SB782_32970, partial [Brevibacillus sp. SIMBA_076]
MASQLRDTSSQARRAYDDMSQSAARSGNTTRAAANATVEANRRSIDSSRQSVQARHAEAEAVRHMADITESSNGRATRSYYNSR